MAGRSIMSCVLVLCLCSIAFCEISETGDIVELEVGYSHYCHINNGQISVTDGSELINEINYYIGYDYDSFGTFTVSGSGSLLSTDFINVGFRGDGLLRISDGALVECSQVIEVSDLNRGGKGEINFENGTLNTATLWASPESLTGTGTINAHSLCSDLDIVIDDYSDLQQTIVLNDLPGQNITINLDMSDHLDCKFAPYGFFAAGYSGEGSLTVSGGLKLEYGFGWLGSRSGSHGVGNISGSGTEVSFRGALDLQTRGASYLNITDGALVVMSSLRSGSADLAAKNITVDGDGSHLDCFWSIQLASNSTLNILNGASANADEYFQTFNTMDYGNTVNIIGVGSNLLAGAMELESDTIINISGQQARIVADSLSWSGAGQINMSSGAMLALLGDVAGDISGFLTLAQDAGHIRYFDSGTGQWTHIGLAGEGEDFTLVYYEDGEFAGFTVLTVMAVPEPATLGIFALGALAVVRRRLRAD